MLPPPTLYTHNNLIQSLTTSEIICKKHFQEMLGVNLCEVCIYYIFVYTPIRFIYSSDSQCCVKLSLNKELNWEDIPFHFVESDKSVPLTQKTFYCDLNQTVVSRNHDVCIIVCANNCNVYSKRNIFHVFPCVIIRKLRDAVARNCLMFVNKM